MAAPATTSPPSFIDRIKALLVTANASISKYAAHLFSQAIVLETVAKSDLSKWQSAISVLATGTGVTLLKRLQAFIKTL